MVRALPALVAGGVVASSWGSGAALPACDVSKTGQEVCDDFCNDRCGFWNASAGETGEPQVVRFYRLTSANLTGLRNKDTADPRGDIGFALSRKNLTATCAKDPSATGCFLTGNDLYGLFEVEVDSQWGPYLQCNPVQIGGHDPVAHPEWVDEQNFMCGMDCLAPTKDGCHTPYPSPPGNTSNDGMFGPKCHCNTSRREDRTVGRAAPIFLQKWGFNHTVPDSWVPQCQLGYTNTDKCLNGTVYQTLQGWSFESVAAMACEACLMNDNCTGWSTADNRTVQLFVGNITVEEGFCTATFAVPGPMSKGKSWFGVGRLGGHWYSTPAKGECQQGVPLGTDGCTWREVTSVYRNASCVDGKVDASIEDYATACMGLCSQPLNRTSDCYLDCYRDALMGNAAKNVTKIPDHMVIEPWEKAFDSSDSAKGGCPVVQPEPCHGDQCDPLIGSGFDAATLVV